MIRWSAWIKYYFKIDCEETNPDGSLKIDDERFMHLIGELQYCMISLNMVS